MPDPDWGERVRAVVVLQPGADPVDGAVLRDFCRDYIANYKLPRSVELVDALPVSGAGKILKRVLRAAQLLRLHGDGASRPALSPAFARSRRVALGRYAVVSARPMRGRADSSGKTR